MKIRDRKSKWRNALGLDQIIATLLVVLPTIAFSVTFLLEYWSVMQIDYKLKVIANMAADKANSSKDPQTEFAGYDQTSALIVTANKICPSNSKIQTPLVPTNSTTAGNIDITVAYSFNGSYIDTNITTNIQTFSFGDQNMSVTLTCK